MPNTLTLPSGLQLNYECHGAGTALLCLPGWGYSTEIFARNLPALSQHYQTFSIDPRSHGRSDACVDGNDYGQHGRDIRAFIQALKLKEFVLLGWSLGVYGIYSYLEQFGFKGVKAIIAVDESPRIIQCTEQDWGEGSEAEVKELIAMVRSGYSEFFREYMAGGFVKRPSDELLDNFTQIASSLTTDAAVNLVQDAAERDYTQIAIKAAQTVPVLNIVRTDWAQAAQRWIAEHQPESETQVLGNHLMLYEFAEEFNHHLLSFLKNSL